MATKEEILAAVSEVLVDSLAVDEEEVTMEATLVDDLGASSATWGEYSYRSYRGGSYSSSARDCIIPLRKSDTERTYHGIRLCWRFPTPPQK